jgi:hypothetical protein
MNAYCYCTAVQVALTLQGVAGFLLSPPTAVHQFANQRHTFHAVPDSPLHSTSDRLFAATLAVQEPDLASELNTEDLGACHGILHASGVRQLSDIKSLTASQIAGLKISSDDRSKLMSVVDKLELDSTIEQLPENQLSTLVNGAFWSGVLVPQQDFCIEAICAENDIFKGRLFTEEQCLQLSRMAENHAYSGAGWTNAVYTLTAQHLLCKDIPGMIIMTSQIFNQLKEKLYTLFPDRIKPGSIVFENSGEPHLVKYNGKSKGTELHKDNAEYTYLTINVVLSADEDFSGGGTYIKALDRTIHLKQGEMLIHLGNLEHAGADITSGVRRLLIAFLACSWEDEVLNIANPDEARDAVPKQVEGTATILPDEDVRDDVLPQKEILLF